jgi:hypothetical protein
MLAVYLNAIQQRMIRFFLDQRVTIVWTYRCSMHQCEHVKVLVFAIRLLWQNCRHLRCCTCRTRELCLCIRSVYQQKYTLVEAVRYAKMPLVTVAAVLHVRVTLQ